MQLSDKQKEFWCAPFHRWNVKHGATRTGKTYLDYFTIPRRIRERMGCEGLVVLLGNTKGTLQRNVIEPMQEIYGASVISSIRSDNTATIFGERVHCLGADSKKHVDRLRGTSIKYCYGDEVVTWEQEVFEMLKSRLDKPYSCFDGTCNPGSPGHWFKEFLDSDADIFQQSYRLDDNPFLDPTVAAQLKKEHAGTVFYNRYILGEWCLAEGLIYPNFNHNAHITENIPELVSLSVSVDAGQSNATVFLGTGEGVDGRLYCVDEYCHSGKKSGVTKSPLAYAKDFDKWVRTFSERFPDVPLEDIWLDPSALGFKAQLRDAGYFARSANNDVLPGIQTVSSLIEADLLRVHPRCTNLLEELHGYAWDKKASERGEDKPIKENDHSCDALRYRVHSTKYDWVGRQPIEVKEVSG